MTTDTTGAVLWLTDVSADTWCMPVHLQVPYRSVPHSLMKVAESLWERIITLPYSTNITDDKLKIVVRSVRNLIHFILNGDAEMEETMCKKIGQRHFILLSCIYLLSQGMLLFVSGRWWDDWCFYNQPGWALKKMAFELGRPSLYWIISFAKLLPESGYRILTFLLFYFCMFFLYSILKTWLDLKSQSCFWICALYAVIPANDARIMLAVFPYSIGLFFVMAGLSNLADLLYGERMNRWRKCINLLFFLLSFILNSNLCFYAIALLMIIMKEKKIATMWKYIDYVLLPMFFFIVKTICFPAHGGYEGYNTVTVFRVIKAFLNVIRALFFVMLDLCANFLGRRKRYVFIAGVILLAINCILNKEKIKKFVSGMIAKKGWHSKRNTETEIDLEDKENLKILAIGLLVLSAGLFAYVAVRQSYGISTTNLSGRDSILLAFGASMIFYSLIRLLFPERAAYFCLIGLILCGILHFNRYYLSYQQDYYRQLGFQYQLTQYPELENVNNIVYLNTDQGLINIRYFYQMNGNAEIVYGNQKRFIMGGFSDTSYLQKEELLSYFVNSGNYHMSDYDWTHKRLDAVIEYSFDVSLRDVIIMKIWEWVDHNYFQEWIQNRSNMVVYLDGTEGYQSILQEVGYENIE